MKMTDDRASKAPNGMRWRYACRVVAGVVFIVSAVLKLVSIDSFELYIYSLGWFPLSLSYVLSRLLVAGEFALGAAIVSAQCQRQVNAAAYGLLIIFSVFLLHLVATGYTGNCHCMGEAVDLPPVPSLLKNAALAALLFVSGGINFHLRHAFAWLCGVGLLAVAAVFIASPPDNFVTYKAPKVHRDQIEQFLRQDSVFQSQIVPQEHAIACFFSTTCRVCRLSARKLQIMLDRHSVPANAVYQIFEGDEDKLADFFEQSEARRYSMRCLSEDEFWRFTSRVPVFVTFRHGIIDSVYNYRTLDEAAVEKMVRKSGK